MYAHKDVDVKKIGNAEGKRVKGGGRGKKTEKGELVSQRSVCRELEFKLYERAYSWVRAAISITGNTESNYTMKQ